MAVLRPYVMLALAGLAPVMANAAEPRMTVAVLDFQSVNAPASDASVLSGFVRDAVVSLGSYLVVERQSMNRVLSEQALQQTGCTDAECAVKLGKLLNASKIIVGTYTILGGVRYLTARLVDVSTGQIDRSSRVRDFDLASGDRAADDLASKLLGAGPPAHESLHVPELPEPMASIDSMGLSSTLVLAIGELRGIRASTKNRARVTELIKSRIVNDKLFIVSGEIVGGITSDQAAVAYGKHVRADLVLRGELTRMNTMFGEKYLVHLIVVETGRRARLWDEALETPLDDAENTVTGLVAGMRRHLRKP